MAEPLHSGETQLSAEQIFHVSDEFLHHFGVEVDPAENPTAFSDALQQLDPRYQGGRDLVRWQLEADQKQWDERTKSVIMQTATGMRMLQLETPLEGSFDAVIALGGARQSNLDRLRYAAEAISSGRAAMKHLVVAGSNRPLSDAEVENTSNYAPGARSEFDLCVGAAALIAKGNPGLTIGINLTENPYAGTPAVIETVLADLQKSGSLAEGSRVAAVTTQIYQTSTALDLARIARKFGASKTFAAGNPSDPNIVAKRTPSTYLSEVLRTLRAAVNEFEASNQPEIPEEIRARVASIQQEIADTMHKAAALQKNIKSIDTAHPELRKVTTEPDGSVYVEEVSGQKWLQRSGPSGLWYDGPDDMVGYYAE